MADPVTSISLTQFNPLNYVHIGNPYTILLDIFIFIFLGGMIYFIFFKKRVLKYHVQIYERENNGIPIPMDTDILEERKLNKGKNTMYWLRKYKAEAHPPTSKFIYKRKKGLFGSESWVDYVRERHQFIPVQRQIEYGLNSEMDLVTYHKKMLEIWNTTPENVRQLYIYSPLIPETMPRLKFEPLDYNLNEMMQTEIAHAEILYADKRSFMEQYGPMVGIGLAAVALIVIAYLGYQFAAQNINGVIEAANTVASRLNDVANKQVQQPPKLLS